MPTFEAIYACYGEDYDALVAREDHQGNILAALSEICPPDGLEIVEMGAGTGRLTRLLAPLARFILACDGSAHMLGVAERTLRGAGRTNWRLCVADNRRLPVATASADLSLSGWSFGHSVAWYPETWRQEIGRMVSEMQRVLRPGGTAIVLETLTTGSEVPRPPTPGLAAYYNWLETEHGFTRRSIRTDYRFETPDEAERLIRFFFGDELADRVRSEQAVTVPECTGVWWRRV